MQPNFTSGKTLHKKRKIGRKEGTPPPKQSDLVPSATIEGGKKKSSYLC